ncbi:hypothetical protein E4T44_11013, partial [Aureobasidium sp. EXF-8845]
MDIDQWIESLEQANPPAKHPFSVDQPHATRKRRRGSGTSSLLEPFVNRERRDIKDRQPVVSVSSSNSDPSDATSASTSSASSEPSISSSSEKYQRRPRHRTKADKYHLNPKSKSQSRKKKKKKEAKEKKSKHASRKKRKSKAVTGLVQSFQAKNVPKDRLTNLFGLPMLNEIVPDLVFSEMKFLQKPETSITEEPDPKPKKKSRQKKRRRTSEKEISRYFDGGGTRPGNDENHKRHPPPLDTFAVARDLQPASPVISDLVEKPFLGFGSRNTHPPTTSYYSWSESGRESSTRAKHFAPDLETVAVGQLQSSRLRDQTQPIPLEHNSDKNISAERAIVQSGSKSQHSTFEPAREIDQATLLPAKPQSVKEVDPKPLPVPISNRHETLVPAAVSPASQAQAGPDSTEEDLAVDEIVPSPPEDREQHGDKSPPKPLSDPMVRQYAEPWEELLQNCELAARPLMPTHYEEDEAPYRTIATQDQYTPATYGHADLQLWRTDDDLPEHDYLDNTAFVGEHVGRARSVTTEYQEDNVQFFEETIDDDSESLDSEYHYE